MTIDETGENEAFTNCLSGCLQPSYSANTQRVVFTALQDGGYDVFMLKNALERPSLQLTPTAFRQKGTVDFEEIPLTQKRSSGETGGRHRPYANYVFAPSGGTEEAHRSDSPADTATSRLPGGGFASKDYRVKLTPDLVNATAAYSSFFGVQGTSQILLSDVLGNHLIYLNTDLYYDFNNLDNTNFQVAYLYLARRLNYGTGIYRNVYYLDAGIPATHKGPNGSFLLAGDGSHCVTRFVEADNPYANYLTTVEFDGDQWIVTNLEREALPRPSEN